MSSLHYSFGDQPRDYYYSILIISLVYADVQQTEMIDSAASLHHFQYDSFSNVVLGDKVQIQYFDFIGPQVNRLFS